MPAQMHDIHDAGEAFVTLEYVKYACLMLQPMFSAIKFMYVACKYMYVSDRPQDMFAQREQNEKQCKDDHMSFLFWVSFGQITKMFCSARKIYRPSLHIHLFYDE